MEEIDVWEAITERGEDVDGKKPCDILVGRHFERAKQAVTGVIDDDIDLTRDIKRLMGYSLRGLAVAKID